MDLSVFTPLWSFVLASLITIWSLGQRKQTRRLSLLLAIWPLNLLSLKTCHHLTWPGGLNSTYASLVIFYFLHTLKVLVLDYQPPRSSGFIDRYKILNNPRGLEARPPFPTHNSSNNHKSESRLRFAIHQSLKIVILFAADTYLVQGVISVFVFTGARPSDFAPYYEVFLFQPVTGRQLLVRAAISVNWIWTAFYLLEASHCAVSLVFVALLRWDEPEEWPSVWGHAGNATSVRGFWGKVWNRITIPTFAFYARLLSSVFGIEKDSWLSKMLVPLFIFLLSGLSHSLGGWAVGDGAVGRDVLFFLLNFLACTVETLIGKTRRWKRCKRGVPAWMVQIAGVVYLFGFFFMTVPLWMYPKIYGALGGM
ncbi:hypothetical protein QBC41DRAFT_397249 [Cercophora samala]|uniref:Wax synthase domain-containing protein n=1 Tax=Cercophora samala TaxID=330535 RepID=A0AA40D8B3_9PEZI|nr:hypothetical protein QBC41DRAFT_397249 [Cercophora samala]